MKTPIRILFITITLMLLTLAARADVELYGPVTPPAFGGTYWSMAHGSAYPPLPCIPLLFANSDVYGIVGYTNQFVYDDTQNPDHTWPEMMTMESEGGGSGEGDGPTPLYADYGTNLWIEIVNLTNQLSDAGTQQVANLFLHKTTAGTVYEIISSVDPSVPMTNWVSEGLWIASGTNTATPVPVWSRTNELCFRGKVWDGTFSHGVATNGQLYLLCQDTNAIQGVINGVTNTITPIYSNWVVLQPPVWTANFGFSGEDLGPSNLFSLFGQQNIHAVLGFSRSISNFALSFNPVSRIDTHSWPNLTYLEMFHATNLISANVTNCPKLYRVCFESIEYVDTSTTNGIKDVLDLTGCTNLADLRAANNNITNIILGPNGGSNIWHFCTRDARPFHSDPIIQGIPFKSLPSLRQLWVWRDKSYVDNIYLTVTNSPKLESVQAYGNYFQSAHFDGQTNLQELLLFSMPSMTNLVVSGCSNLINLDASGDSLSRSVIEAILTTLDQMGTHGGALTLNGSGNAAPSNVGLTAVDSLRAKSWTVQVVAQNPFISGLAVNANTNSATITWTTDVSSDSVVYYGTTTSYGSSTNGNSGTTSHSVTITNLTPNTTYHFYVTSTAGASTGYSGDSQFLTAIPGAIRFVSTSTSVNMHVAVSGSATVTFMWGDNTTNSSTLHTFSTSGPYTNYLTVVPTNALTEFGIICSGSTTLSSVSGLTNYPSVQDLFFYQSGLSEISLAGGTNLVHIALAACSPTSATEDQWFIDLAAAQPSLAPGTAAYCDGFQNYFFYPSSPGPTSASLSARSYLSGLGWHLFAVP